MIVRKKSPKQKLTNHPKNKNTQTTERQQDNAVFAGFPIVLLFAFMLKQKGKK